MTFKGVFVFPSNPSAGGAKILGLVAMVRMFRKKSRYKTSGGIVNSVWAG